ncbi:natural resistance-associated macrophage protein [Xylariaceae sp. FL1272]|nr:natural resistance-associated macrophage protein [Xylariaceae sp. FL1272]
MNRTSRTDEPLKGTGHNQSPNPLSNDLVTNEDLNGKANAREHRGGKSRSMDNSGQPIAHESPPNIDDDDDGSWGPTRNKGLAPREGQSPATSATRISSYQAHPSEASSIRQPSEIPTRKGPPSGMLQKLAYHVFTLGKFVGPGFMVAVAYIDPGNYSTDISAGAEYRFRLLFIVLASNIFAIVLQCLAVKLGTVTGLNLAEACRAFLPKWFNIFLYILAEAAIIATDIAEVIGTAIGLNLLIPQIPLVAGCALSILDVFAILFFYRPNGPMTGLRIFEIFVMILVLIVVISFAIQLSLIKDTTPGEVLKGYLPNDAITESSGLYQACGILGATVMPHSLFLGSGIVQSRLREYDTKRGLLPEGSTGHTEEDPKTGEKQFYVPSLAAVKHSLKYSYTEVSVSLFTFALFVNSAILIVAGASLYGNPEALDADIFGIHDLLSRSISPFAGTIFALALLFSGISAGIVCTIAGQMVCEGALNWKMKPWVRRLVTRSIAITPSIIIAGATGRGTLNAALNGSQVVLSIVLPFVSGPLIWFTCFNKYMTTAPGSARVRVQNSKRDGGITDTALDAGDEERGQEQGLIVKMANSWPLAVAAVVIWLLIVVLNVANLVLLGMGQ